MKHGSKKYFQLASKKMIRIYHVSPMLSFNWSPFNATKIYTNVVLLPDKSKFD